jgi:hypothetical protein
MFQSLQNLLQKWLWSDDGIEVLRVTLYLYTLAHAERMGNYFRLHHTFYNPLCQDAQYRARTEASNSIILFVLPH